MVSETTLVRKKIASNILLTLSACAAELWHLYVCICVGVCLSVTILPAMSLISMCKTKSHKASLIMVLYLVDFRFRSGDMAALSLSDNRGHLILTEIHQWCLIQLKVLS